MALADRKWCLGCDTLGSVSLIPKYCSSWEVLVSHLQGYRLGLKKEKKNALKPWSWIWLEGAPATVEMLSPS